MAGATDYHRGEMEISEQASTFHGFILMSKWLSLALAAVLSFFIIWLSAHAPFMISALAGIVIAGVGYLALREKKSAGH